MLCLGNALRSWRAQRRNDEESTPGRYRNRMVGGKSLQVSHRSHILLSRHVPLRFYVNAMLTKHQLLAHIVSDERDAPFSLWQSCWGYQL